MLKALLTGRLQVPRLAYPGEMAVPPGGDGGPELGSGPLRGTEAVHLGGREGGS